MAWYHMAGPESDVVISTRVRYARNINGYPFPVMLDAKGAREIIDKASVVLSENGFSLTDFTDIPRAAAYSLVEKHYISPVFVRESLPHALFLNEPCGLSVMVCEEDHFRIQCILPGLALSDACAGAGKVERLLDHSFDLAFDERFGYLTQSPANAGLAMRASVMAFLPCTCLSGRSDPLFYALNQSGLTIRGLFGEKSASQGFLFQISNQTAACPNAEAVLSLLSEASERIMETERRCRESFTGDVLIDLKDRIGRAEGILRCAYKLTSEEFLSAWALVKLGLTMGIVNGSTHEALTTLLVEMMPATLMLSADPAPEDGTALDILRARVMRDRLHF